jgi:predicted RNase H-like HicB family nuclease
MARIQEAIELCIEVQGDGPEPLGPGLMAKMLRDRELTRQQFEAFL